jgi:Ca2+-dependent lipid-binding protein
MRSQLTIRSEQAYGSWFHNAGIVRPRLSLIVDCPNGQILFAVLSTRFITTIHLGWGWVILILVACASYYTLSIRRTRERARDDMQRELVKTRLVTETESADWMNSFLERFWLM